MIMPTTSTVIQPISPQVRQFRTVRKRTGNGQKLAEGERLVTIQSAAILLHSLAMIVHGLLRNDPLNPPGTRFYLPFSALTILDSDKSGPCLADPPVWNSLSNLTTLRLMERRFPKQFPKLRLPPSA